MRPDSKAKSGQAVPGPLPEPLEGHPYYVKIRDLNAGTFGFVQLARDTRTGEEVAVKFIERGDPVTKYVEREIKNHRILVHPHIIHFKEVFLTPKYLAIVMEYASGGDMFEYVSRKGGLHEYEARWFFQQLIMALDYCHRMGVVNRDIKLENALLDRSARPLVKLCDFGYSKHTQEHSQPKSKIGTPGYIAPEVILNKEYNGELADVWSCGVMLYVMLVGAYPFERSTDKNDPAQLQKMIQRILKVAYEIPPHLKISPECKDLLSRILVADPAKRITIKQIYKHPWYQTGLPPGVDTMNDNWHVDISKLSPTAEEVEAIVREARHVPGAAAVECDVDGDSYVDSILESMA